MSIADGFWFQIGRGLAYFAFFVGSIATIFISFYIAAVISDCKRKKPNPPSPDAQPEGSEG